MAAMFTMMNEARLGVGMQGLGIAEAAYQGAVAYARDRRQGRALSGAKEPLAPADPIIVHPDVRRMLLTQRACVEGARALAAWVALELDRRDHAKDPETRNECEDFVALMTPIVKALFTDFGSESANLGVQVLGGHGYIQDNGMEQFIRDARIAQIYEGTNGIQALDLLGRKMAAHAGRLLRRFFHPAQAFIDANRNDPAMAEFVTPLARAFGGLQKITVHLAQTGLAKPEEAAAGATEYLRAFGLVALALMWARMAKVALTHADSPEDAGFYRAKLATARFYMQRVLPQTAGLMGGIMGGGRILMDFDDAQF
jgi:butyryl-CoA dehydrogenase